MRKSFWLFAIVLSMSLGIRAQAAPREIPDHFNTGVDTDTELTEIPEPGIYGGIQYKTGAGGHCVASRIRWLSPPERLTALRSRDR